MPANADQDERLFLRKLPVDAPPSAIARRQLRAEMMEVRKSIAHFSLDERRAAMTAWRVESDEKFTRIAELRVIEAAESRLSMPKADRRPEGYLQMPTALLARFELREVIQAELQAIVDRLGSGREDERAEALAKWNESRRQRMEEIVRSAENEIQEEVR